MIYALNRLILPSLWHVQVGIDLIQIKVGTLEQTIFCSQKSQDVPSSIRLGMIDLHP